MKNHSLDELLDALRDRPAPPAPSRLEQDVWREIRQRNDSASRTDLIAWLIQAWTQPRFAVLAVVAAIIVGAAMQGVVLERDPASATRRALRLDVFTAMPLLEPSGSAEL